MTPALRQLLDDLIRDRATSADIPWHTTTIIDAIEDELQRQQQEERP